MKKTFFILGTAFILLASFTASVKSEGNDNCKSYFPMAEGTTLTYENYNAKDKLQTTDQFTVKSVVESAEATIITANMKSTDKKGEEFSSNDVEFVCEDGVFKISMESMIPAGTMDSFKDMEVVMTQSELEIPSVLSVGLELPDATMKIVASSNGMKLTMNLKVTERKIEAQESVTTAAGTFECYKLSQTTNTKMAFIDKTFKSIDWITEGIGSVRSESYTEKGKLESYNVLTNITR
jgi:hypothetical protein